MYKAIQNSQRMFKPLCPPKSYLVLVLGATKDSAKRWRASYYVVEDWQFDRGMSAVKNVYDLT